MDDQVFRGDEAFAFGGRVRVLSVPAEAIGPGLLKETRAEALVVRSTTRVDDALLEGSSLEFLGTATVGEDHVVREALHRRGIAYRAAPGSSAGSVAEFTLAIIHLALDRLGRSADDVVLAVVGAGRIGERVARAGEDLGWEVIRHDPPLAERTGDGLRYAPRRALARATVVSLHVPLVTEGPHRTRRLVDQGFLGELAPGAVLVNTSRGNVIDEEALLRGRSRLGGLVLDVFPGEPRPSSDLLEACDLATPHVAGRSLEGMLAGTRMVARSLARLWDMPEPDLPLPPAPTGAVPRVETPVSLIRSLWDLEDMSHAVRKDPRLFKSLRRRRPLRRDLSALCPRIDGPAPLRRFTETLAGCHAPLPDRDP